MSIPPAYITITTKSVGERLDRVINQTITRMNCEVLDDQIQQAKQAASCLRLENLTRRSDVRSTSWKSGIINLRRQYDRDNNSNASATT